MSVNYSRLQTDNRKLNQQLDSRNRELTKERLTRDLIIRRAARHSLLVHMYTTLFAETMLSIEEDVTNAGTLSEARSWVIETVNKFRSVLEARDGDNERDLDGFIEFDQASVRLKFDEIVEQMNKEWL